MVSPARIAAWLLSILLPGAAVAATYDPDLKWRTITTDHFHIHFHQGEERLADEFSEVIEEVYDHMNPQMRWTPRRRTEVVLVDRTDVANGYAQSIPYNTIVIYVTAPQEDSTLGLYEDWSTAIAMHEYAHILHLDTNHGIVRAARYVVGRIASTNELSPPWMIEGLATFHETRQTAGGRGRASLAHMIKRTSVVEDDFPPLGNLDGLQPNPPGGNLRYLFGQDFIQFISDQTGEDVWTRWTHTYGSHVPFLLPSRKVFGRTLQSLYYDWRDHLEERYGEQVAALEAEGLREGELVSDSEASCSAPSFAPDGGKLVYSCYDLRTGSAIWLADGEGGNAEKLKQDYGAKNFTWRVDSKAFVFAATHLVNRFNTWSDIYLMQLEGKQPVTSLTNGSRARDPDFSPDGSHLMVVTNKVQNNQLEVLTVDRRQVKLTDYDDNTQLSTPRYDPSGTVVAVSVWQEGRRDLWLYDTAGEPVRRLTFDAAVDRDPEWSDDGRWLVFSSDRTGIPNIFAIDTETEQLFQVTNVRTGAAKPTLHPSGDRLAYQQYSANGWDVRVMDFDPADFIDRGTLPRPLTNGRSMSDILGAPDLSEPDAEVAAAWDGPALKKPRYAPPHTPLWAGRAPSWLGQAPTESIDTFDQDRVKDVFGDEQDYPFRIEPHRYNPFSTLLPRFWLPYIQSTPYDPTVLTAFPLGLRVNAYAFSADTLRHVAWSASGSYRTDADYFGWSGDITWNRYLPVFTVGAYRSAVPYTIYAWVEDTNGDGLVDEETELGYFEQPHWQSRTTGYFFTSYPYTPRTTIFAQYSLQSRTGHTEVPTDAYDPLVPVTGTLGKIEGGWRYAWAQQTAYAISTEDGRIFSLVGGLLHPYLGTRVTESGQAASGVTQVQLTSEIREYIVNPLAANHVLAMRAAGGVTFGATDYLGYYQLGGSYGDSAVYVVPDEFRMVRGYRIGSDSGDRYWLGGVEYRFPILRIDRGFGTVPAFFRYISGAAFVDTGNAFTDLTSWRQAFDNPLIGVGAELRGSVAVGWSTYLNGRLGYAVGLTGNGITPTEAAALYFQLGGSF